MIPNVKFFKQGKVRDIYELGENLLIVTSNRISAFDVLMGQEIPCKGRMLNQIAKFWFEKTKHIIDNHLITANVEEYPAPVNQYKQSLGENSMLVERTEVIPMECVVRGYLAGSAWVEYQKSQTICGVKLPAGLKEFERLPEPIFTPATKADEGHDENISFEEMSKAIGSELAEKLKQYSIDLYNFGYDYLIERGIILADTKFEFGRRKSTGEIILIDEALTPDSSRLWLLATYKPGIRQQQFDKQVLRDYLLGINWDKSSPAPKLPAEVIEFTKLRYKEAFTLITGQSINC